MRWASWFLGITAAVLATMVEGDTKTFQWEMSYITASPNGVSRSVIGVNGQFPPPTITVEKNDQVVIQVTNSLNDGEYITLHTHGIFQNGTNFFDGVDQVTQCGIPPGETFEYNFNVGNQTGTYWIHSHVKGQYPNGLRAPFIILDPEPPYPCDNEIVLSVSDWYNETMQTLIPQFMSPANADGAEPVPDAALIFDSQNGTIPVTEGELVRFHVANIGAFGFFHIWIEGHNMTVIEVDGVDVEPYVTEGINVAVGQRLSVLVSMDANPSLNYPIVAAMDQSMFDSSSANPNTTAWLVYNSSAPNPEPAVVSTFFEFDDTELVPLNPLPVTMYDTIITADVNFTTINGINFAIINNNTYVPPSVPTLFTALTTGQDATNPAIYGNTTNPFVLNHLDMIWLVINNDDSGSHPFHLHGHSFQVLFRSDSGVGHFNPDQLPEFPDNPLQRDVVLVNSGGYAILAFRADNPGVWYFHCHIDWHVVAGMVAQFIEAPLEMQNRLVVPQQVQQQCMSAGIPISGQAN